MRKTGCANIGLLALSLFTGSVAYASFYQPKLLDAGLKVFGWMQGKAQTVGIYASNLMMKRSVGEISPVCTERIVNGTEAETLRQLLTSYYTLKSESLDSVVHTAAAKSYVNDILHTPHFQEILNRYGDWDAIDVCRGVNHDLMTVTTAITGALLIGTALYLYSRYAVSK